MKEPKWIVAYFSPPGGTKKIADAIAESFHSPVQEMDLTKPDCDTELSNNDSLLAVLPVYAGRVPQIALERLDVFKAAGQKAAAVVVYGNREYDDALLELKDSLEKIGFQVIAAAAFIAEHSMIRSIATARPDETDRKIAHQFGADVIAKLNNPTPIQVPGNTPYRELKPSEVHPIADDTCVNCGICAGQCPVGAISTEDPRQTVSACCINCMRCIQVCPHSSRFLPDAFLASATAMLNEKASGHKAPALFL